MNARPNTETPVADLIRNSSPNFAQPIPEPEPQLDVVTAEILEPEPEPHRN